jgi:hypothetical protein
MCFGLLLFDCFLNQSLDTLQHIRFSVGYPRIESGFRVQINEITIHGRTRWQGDTSEPWLALLHIMT